MLSKLFQWIALLLKNIRTAVCQTSTLLNDVDYDPDDDPLSQFLQF